MRRKVLLKTRLVEFIGRRRLILVMDSFDLKENRIEFKRKLAVDIIRWEELSLLKCLLRDIDWTSSVINCFEVKFLSQPDVVSSGNGITVTIVQGYELDECPKPIIQAMLLLISDYYERTWNREQGLNPASNNLLRQLPKIQLKQSIVWTFRFEFDQILECNPDSCLN